MREPDSYWYSLIGASPLPESGESVNVALAFGNGRVIRLDFDDRLSRLQGLVSADHRALYSAMLAEIGARVTEGVTLEDLALALGPQFAIGEPRPLQVEYSDRVVRALRVAYLSPAASPREQLESFSRQALRKLDHHYREIAPAGVEYLRGRYSLSDVYEQKLDRYVTVKVPPIRRMIRTYSRDVLLNTLSIRKGVTEHVIDHHVARASRQFYAFRELQEKIKSSTGKEVKRVGIIQPLPGDASRAELELANWATEVWQSDAEVLRPQSGEDVQRALKSLTDWAQAA